MFDNRVCQKKKHSSRLLSSEYVRDKRPKLVGVCTYVYVCMYVYICMYICTYVCIYYVYTYVCIYICVCVRTYVCIYVGMDIRQMSQRRVETRSQLYEIKGVTTRTV